MKHRGSRATLWLILGLAGWVGMGWGLASESVQGDLDGSGTIDAVDLVLLANLQAGNVDTVPGQFGQLWEVDPVVGALRRIPAGTFTQGSPVGEPCREPYYPGIEAQFDHSLTRNLAVMETEVTRQMWADLRAAQSTLPADPTNLSWGSGMDNPVQSVNWRETLLFANLLSLQVGLTRCYYKSADFSVPLDATNYGSGQYYCDWDADGYRLPTEAEWERCCRGGTATPFWIAEPNYTADTCNGSSPGLFPALETAAWFYDNAGSLLSSLPVGMKPANPWGLYDTHGNVWEWCWDWYQLAYPAGSATDYTGPASGSMRIQRGGSWDTYAQGCRSAFRNWYDPGTRGFSAGFRLVRSVP